MNDPDLTTIHARRAVKGDQESLSWIITRLTPLLKMQATYRLGTVLRKHLDPEDLVNDVWLRTLPRLEDLTPREGRITPVLLRFLSTTLLRCVNNLVRKHVGGERPFPLVAGEEGEDHIPLPSDATGVVTAACRRERKDAVTGCLETMDGLDREILVLRGIEQHPNQAVAQLLGLKPTTVSTRYQRALEKLREKLPESVFAEL